MHCRMASTKAPGNFWTEKWDKNAALNVYLRVLKDMTDYILFITQNTTKYLYIKTARKAPIPLHKIYIKTTTSGPPLLWLISCSDFLTST